MTQPTFDFTGIPDKFVEFHQANPVVYEKLREYALLLKKAGRQRLGISAVFERLRWWSAIETTGDKFKLNNNYRAFYARLLMQNEPELAGFFETRKSCADKAA